MTGETWKASERRMAAIIGGVRVPVTGRARGSVPDIEGASVAGRRLAVEHKYGSRIIRARRCCRRAQLDGRRRTSPLSPSRRLGLGG